MGRPHQQQHRQVVGYSFHAGDLFHIGHLMQLSFCRDYCDYLIVGLLTDQAIASYKRMPVIPYPQREEIYLALRWVDRVVAQDSRDPTDTLKNLIERGQHIDVLFHGNDWTAGIPGREYIERMGGALVITPYWHGQTTSEIIRRIREREEWEKLL